MRLNRDIWRISNKRVSDRLRTLLATLLLPWLFLSACSGTSDVDANGEDTSANHANADSSADHANDSAEATGNEATGIEATGNEATGIEADDSRLWTLSGYVISFGEYRADLMGNAVVELADWPRPEEYEQLPQPGGVYRFAWEPTQVRGNTNFASFLAEPLTPDDDLPPTEGDQFRFLGFGIGEHRGFEYAGPADDQYVGLYYPAGLRIESVVIQFGMSHAEIEDLARQQGWARRLVTDRSNRIWRAHYIIRPATQDTPELEMRVDHTTSEGHAYRVVISVNWD